MADVIAEKKSPKAMIFGFLKQNTMLIALVAVMVLFEILMARTTGEFNIFGMSLFSPSNITNIINQNGYVVILATGMLMCILTGGNIDLSIGSIVCLVGAVCGTMIVNHGANIYLTIVVCLCVGTFIGAWHAFWIAYVHIPPFICTLSGMLLWRGVSLIILDGLTISPFPDNYLNLFSSYIGQAEKTKDIIGTLYDFAGEPYQDIIWQYSPKTLAFTVIVGAICCGIMIFAQLASRLNKQRKGYSVQPFTPFIIKQIVISIVVMAVTALLGLHNGIPVILILLAVVIAAYSYYTQNTVPGRYLYAIGGNAKAAKLSGVNTDKVMFFAYTNMGFLSAVAALACVARFNSAAPTAGQNYEMDAIGSCFIGGASAYGGTGTVGGAVIGAIFMGVLNNGMSILGVDSNWQKAVKGLVLLLAVIFDVTSKGQAKTNRKGLLKVLLKVLRLAK
ncbi:multiple monosaccharide ABC transporter permease [uncultured Treponema sp.]|uniref:multiple monosaccharide ABC transporter permease n=1 Tax=Treponema sp. TaxID=166 RepID=UPI00298E4A8B|nr:multiple monosaccharide ABC transporter permease [uncultured Treponema sp.]